MADDNIQCAPAKAGAQAGPPPSRGYIGFGRSIHRFPAALSLFLGALAALGFAPLEVWPLTVACLAAWLWLVHDAPTLRQALLRGWVFGVGHFTVANSWIQQAFEYQQAMPPALGYGAVVALALYLAVYPALAAGLAWRLARGVKPDAAFALAFGAAWIVTEWLRSQLFTGYVWNPLGVIWVPVQPVAHIAAWVGTYALSGLTVVLAGVLLLIPRRPASMLTATAGLAALLAGQWASYRGVAPSRDTPIVRIVQPGIGQDLRSEEDREPMLRTLIALSGKPGPAPRLIVWPEGVVRDLVEDGYPWRYYFWQDSPRRLRARLASVLGPRDVLLFGGNALDFDAKGELQTATNSIYALGAGGRLIGRYDKAHLVPYGEYLPMRGLLEPLGLSRIVPGDLDFRDGPGPRGMALGTFGRVAMQICYEIVFSGQVVDRANRPTLMFNPSNDAWFGAWGPPQHLAQARLRAIEEGVAIVRATPTGISAAIGADGALLARVPGHGPGAIEVPLPAARAPTLFATLGNWLAAAVVALLAALAIALRRRAR
ncbi:MAG: apolipoprotein N-acyltransferase [Pseudomonadota bacterium]